MLTNNHRVFKQFYGYTTLQNRHRRNNGIKHDYVKRLQ